MTPSSYATTAYSPASLQSQAPGKSRSGLKRLAGQRLPWGNTQEVVPDSFMQPEPKSLRFWEQENKRKADLKAKGTYKPAPLEHIDFHDRCDHEHYRHAPWAARTHFWIYLATFGKGFFFFSLYSVRYLRCWSVLRRAMASLWASGSLSRLWYLYLSYHPSLSGASPH